MKILGKKYIILCKNTYNYVYFHNRHYVTKKRPTTVDSKLILITG